MKIVKTRNTTISLLFALGFSTSACAGFYVSSGDLYDGNGNKFVMRGINHSHTWFPDKLDASITGIADTQSNTVRVVLSNGHRWTKNSGHDVANVIQKSKDNNLVVVLDVHDTTGFGEESSAASLSSAVDYWISIKDQLIGQEDYVIINIGNEPVGNNQAASVWIDGHKNAITRLRNAGFTHTLMVDAPNWGQDWQNVMRDNATSVFNHDPQKNIVFSVHMYEVYNSDAKVNNYISAFANNNMPLVIGEFSSTHKGSNVDEVSIMARAEYYDIGYLGWSWSGNDASTADLDIAQNWNSNTLSEWGEILISGTNGINTTSIISSIYTGSPTGNYPRCSSLSADPDGDGWGWENNASCTVASHAPNGFAYCSSASVDPDNDGWGWENNASCVVYGSSVDY